MRRFLFTSLLLLFLTARATVATPVAPAPVPGDLLLAHQRVLVLGESITQDGRYVTFLEYYLHRLAPGAKCDLVSIGLSSETVSGLTENSSSTPRPWVLERLDRALQAVKPTVVLACYGMNDGIYHPSSPERLAAFQSGMHQLIAKVRASRARLILITPPVFDPQPILARTVPVGTADFGYSHPFAGYDTVLAEFARAEVALAGPDITVIDVHTPMAGALAAARVLEPATTFSPDGVHPNDTGHLLMGRVLAAGIGLKLPAAELGTELNRIAADPLFALARDRRTLRSEVWLPYVGYTHGQSFKSASVTAAERIVASLQQQIEALAAP